MNTLSQTYRYFDTAGLDNRAEGMKSARNLEEARSAAEDFEAFFLSRMTETMFEGISTDGMFGGGNAEKIYRSLLINEYGKAMARTGTVGVADYVMRSILEIQERAGQTEEA